MKKKRLFWIIAGAVLVIAIILIALNTYSRTIPLLNADGSHKFVLTGGAIGYWPTEEGALFHIDLRKNSAVTFGREDWEKGDEIVFSVRADQELNIKIGIIPAENMEEGYNYDSYGLMIGREVSVTEDVQEISFIVPETGEYGICGEYMRGKQSFFVGLKGYVSFELEVNRDFKNPLVPR